jgi:hypothetical protein
MVLASLPLCTCMRATHVGDVDVGAMVDQNESHFGMAIPACVVQRCVAMVVGLVDIGVAGDQNAHQPITAIAACIVQRCVVIDITLIDISAMVDQNARHFIMAIATRILQRCGNAVPLVDIGIVIEQNACHFAVAIATCSMQRCGGIVAAMVDIDVMISDQRSHLSGISCLDGIQQLLAQIRGVGHPAGTGQGRRWKQE